MKCPNCGEFGRHFVMPCMGEEGFYTCAAASALNEQVRRV